MSKNDVPKFVAETNCFQFCREDFSLVDGSASHKFVVHEEGRVSGKISRLSIPFSFLQYLRHLARINSPKFSSAFSVRTVVRRMVYGFSCIGEFFFSLIYEAGSFFGVVYGFKIWFSVKNFYPFSRAIFFYCFPSFIVSGMESII